MSLLKWLRTRKRHKGEGGLITAKAEISSVLTMARRQRSRIELAFDRDEGQRHTVTCILFEVNKDHLVLELPGFLTISRAWRGNRVDCSFTLSVQENHEARFGFTSFVNELETRENVPCILLSLPRKMELRQNRVHLRIQPPDTAVRELAVWPAPRGRRTAEGIFSTIPSPAARWIPSHFGPVRLLDLSAGGARLELKAGDPESRIEDLRNAKYLLVRLEIGEGNGTCIYHLLALVRNTVQARDSENLELGMEFRMLFRQDEQEKRWEKIDSRKGIDSLGNWVLQRHLELYREKGLT